MELFFNENIDSNTVEFKLDGFENKHITKTLRKKEGEIIEFTNGKKYCFKTKLINASIKVSTFKVISSYLIKSTKFLHVGISILKSPSRLEVFFEKAVEIGVSEITPIIANRSLKKTLNTKRINKILISALKQSYKFNLPKLNNPILFDDFIKNNNEKIKLIATCENLKKYNLYKLYKKNSRNLIMIGPEGDFTKQELEKANNNGFKNVSLGDTRLRSETAGIVACVIFSMI